MLYTVKQLALGYYIAGVSARFSKFLRIIQKLAHEFRGFEYFLSNFQSFFFAVFHFAEMQKCVDFVIEDSVIQKASLFFLIGFIDIDVYGMLISVFFDFFVNFNVRDRDGYSWMLFEYSVYSSSVIQRIFASLTFNFDVKWFQILMDVLGLILFLFQQFQDLFLEGGLAVEHSICAHVELWDFDKDLEKVLGVLRIFVGFVVFEVIVFKTLICECILPKEGLQLQLVDAIVVQLTFDVIDGVVVVDSAYGRYGEMQIKFIEHLRGDV